MMRTRKLTLTFGQLFVGLFIAESLCAILAYSTLGDLAGFAYVFGVILLNSIVVALSFRNRTAAVVGAVVVALLVIPYQVVLGHRWLIVQEEADRIVAYAYERRTSNGSFPADLSDYQFRNAYARTFIQGNYLVLRGNFATDEQGQIYYVEGKGFELCYWVGIEGTPHCYTPATGWRYYSDLTDPRGLPGG